MAFVQTLSSSGVVLETLNDEVAWIMSLKSKLNPYSVKPTECISMVISHSWHDILRSLVIKDLRANLLGKRNHLWAAKNCMIVFFLTSDPALLESKGFYNMSEAEIEASDRFGFIDNYVHSATWIFCPQTFGPCSQTTRIAQAAAYARRVAPVSISWEKRKPRLSLSDMYSAPTSPTGSSASTSSDVSSIESDDSSSSNASQSTSPSTSISISSSPHSSFTSASSSKKAMDPATTATVSENCVSHFLYDKPRLPRWNPILRPALRSGGNRLTSFGTVSDDMDHFEDDDDEDYYGGLEEDGVMSLESLHEICIVPHGAFIYQRPSLEYHALAPRRSWTGGKALVKPRDHGSYPLTVLKSNKNKVFGPLHAETPLPYDRHAVCAFFMVGNQGDATLERLYSSPARKARGTVSKLIKRFTTFRMK